MQHIAIIGNGIAGITAARYVRKLNGNCQITVISAETNHFFARTALMYIYMGHLTYAQTKPYEDNFWQKNRIDLLNGYVKYINTNANTLYLSDNRQLNYHKLLIATGSKPNFGNWSGHNLPGVQGLYSYQDLELLEKNTNPTPQHAVIVGGGLIGIELAEMLHSRGIQLSLLVREANYWGNILPPQESEIVAQQIQQRGIRLKLNTQLAAINPNATTGRVGSVTTTNNETIFCDFVGLTAGVQPNIGFLQDSNIATDKGVLVNHYLNTNIPNIFAAGDCAQFIEPLPNRNAIEQVWYTGLRQGATAAYNLCGYNLPYQPRLWFNSAKFFDLEYQIYGKISANPNSQTEQQLFWQHATKPICLRLAIIPQTQILIGISSIGMRLNHDVCEQWITDKRNLLQILPLLHEANFNPEFYANYYPDKVKKWQVLLQ